VKIVIALLLLSGLTVTANASVIYTLTEGVAAVNSRTYAGTTDYNISPSYIPGGGDPRLTFSFALATALAPNTTTQLIYKNVEGINVPGTQVLSFSYFGGGLGLNLSNLDFDTPFFGYDGNGNFVRTTFVTGVTTDSAGVIQYYSFRAAAKNLAVPSLFTSFNVERSITNPVLNIGAGSVSLIYRFISGSNVCALNCFSPVFSQMADTTIPSGGGNGGGPTGGLGGNTTVPEPASAFLIAVGLGFALYHRRTPKVRHAFRGPI